MRIHHVKKAKKIQGACTCGRAIGPGDPYKWIKKRYGSKQVKCVNCGFRPSEMTNSKMGSVWDAQEDTHKDINDWNGESIDDLKSVLESFAETVREVGEEYRESVENMPENLQESPVAEECTEKADNLESWADELENTDFEDFEEEEVTEEVKAEAEETADAECSDDDKDGKERKKFIASYMEKELESRLDDARQDWASNQRSTADEAVDNDPT